MALAPHVSAVIGHYYGTRVLFIRENNSALYSLVDLGRIVLTYASIKSYRLLVGVSRNLRCMAKSPCCTCNGYLYLVDCNHRRSSFFYKASARTLVVVLDVDGMCIVWVLLSIQCEERAAHFHRIMDPRSSSVLKLDPHQASTDDYQVGIRLSAIPVAGPRSRDACYG